MITLGRRLYISTLHMRTGEDYSKFEVITEADFENDPSVPRVGWLVNFGDYTEEDAVHLYAAHANPEHGEDVIIKVKQPQARANGWPEEEYRPGEDWEEEFVKQSQELASTIDQDTTEIILDPGTDHWRSIN